MPLCGLAFTTRDFSFSCLSLRACEFARGTLPEMGRECFLFTWHLLLPASERFVQVSGEHPPVAVVLKTCLGL